MFLIEPIVLQVVLWEVTWLSDFSFFWFNSSSLRKKGQVEHKLNKHTRPTWAYVYIRYRQTTPLAKLR